MKGHDIITYNIDTTLVATMPIAASDQKRRAREKAAVHAILRQIIGDDYQLTHRSDGAPLLQGYYISISHSSQMAVVAVDRTRPIGIDAEEWRPTLRRVAERFLSDSELAAFTDDASLLAAWTIKEAVYKLVGEAAVDFRKSILISADMSTVQCAGHEIDLHPLECGHTRISLVSFVR